MALLFGFAFGGFTVSTTTVTDGKVFLIRGNSESSMSDVLPLLNLIVIFDMLQS